MISIRLNVLVPHCLIIMEPGLSSDSPKLINKGITNGNEKRLQ
jgi:hypothetical protein